MISELDCIVLTTDIPESGLPAGDIGTLVMVHRNGQLQEFDQRRHGANLGEHEGDEPHQQNVAVALEFGLELAAEQLELSQER